MNHQNIQEEKDHCVCVTSLCVILSPSSFLLADTLFFLATTQSTDDAAATSAENPIPGPHQTSWKSTQVPETSSTTPTPWHVLLLLLLLLLFLLCFFFLFLFLSQSAEDRITAGTDTCCDAPAVQPSPLNVVAEKLLLPLLLLLLLLFFFFFFLILFWPLACVVSISLDVLLLEKVERREEMVVLQRVDWIVVEICGLGSVSEIKCLNWFLGLLHFMCSVTTGMV